MRQYHLFAAGPDNPRSSQNAAGQDTDDEADERDQIDLGRLFPAPGRLRFTFFGSLAIISIGGAFVAVAFLGRRHEDPSISWSSTWFRGVNCPP
jgi:hypothetical protein